MKNGPLIILLVVILIMAGVGFYIYDSSSKGSSSSTPSSSSSPSSSSEPNPIITSESSASPSCTLSTSISGTSSTYHLIRGADTIISSGASVTYNPSNPRSLTLTNSGTAGGGQITITNACGDINRITGILTLGQFDYSLTIIPGSLLYINQYAFNVDRNASNTPPPPSYGGSGGISGYTRKGASGDVRGFDITGPAIPTITSQACANACNGIDACIGFSIDQANTICNLKAAGYGGGLTNPNQAQTVSFYSKDVNEYRFFVLYHKDSQKWLTIQDNNGGSHKGGNAWYFNVGAGSSVNVRSNWTNVDSRTVWMYDPVNQYIISVISGSVLSYDTSGNVSIQGSGTSSGTYSQKMYYKTSKTGGTCQLISSDDTHILATIPGKDDVRFLAVNPIGSSTQWELIYLPPPTVSFTLPTQFEWTVAFLLRIHDKINGQYQYLACPTPAPTGVNETKNLTCITGNPYKDPNAIWSCYGQTSAYALIYVRCNTTLCISAYNDETSLVNVNSSALDCNQNKNQGTGWNFTSDGYFTCYGKYLAINSLNLFHLTNNKSAATKIDCIQINPADLVLNNYKKNVPEIF
jgi:hypothetical protein